MDKSLFYLKNFFNTSYLDRVWIKVYPKFFTNLRIKEYMDIYREYRSSGKFSLMTDHAFTLYRTLLCIKIGLKHEIDPLFLSVEKCSELLKYGEQVYFNFSGSSEHFFIVLNENSGSIFTIEQIKSVRFIPFYTEKGVEKVIYYEKYPWLKVMVFPYIVKFRPLMVRLFVNPLVYGRKTLGIDFNDYIANSENWIDPRLVDLERFRKIQLDFMNSVRDIAYNEFKTWFGVDEDLIVKVSQVEYVIDLPGIDKIKILNSMRFIPGVSKTLKHGLDKTYTTFGRDIGLKYYITLKKGLQFKIYTKAIHKSTGEHLTRFEITLRVNKNIELVDYFRELASVEEIASNLDKILFYINDKESYEKVIKLLNEFIPKNVNHRNLHYILLFDLFVNGQIKGSSVFNNIVRIYKKRGIVKIHGRGVNTVYVLNHNLIPVYEKIREILNLPLKLIELPELPTTPREKT